MNHYNNPHVNYQQPQQTGMYPQQQQPMQMQQQQLTPQQIQQAAYILRLAEQQQMQQQMQQQQQFNPQYAGMSPMQQFPQQQFAGQQQFPQQQPQMMSSTSRFSSGPVQQQFQPTSPNDTSRFSTGQSSMQTTQPIQPPQQVQQVEAQPVVSNPMYVVRPKTHQFATNTKFKLQTITSEFKATSVRYISGPIATETLDDCIESLIEVANTGDETKQLTVRDFLVTTTFYRSEAKALVKQLLETKNIKKLYNQLKEAYATAENKYVINVLDNLDNILTEAVNDYSHTQSKLGAQIDSVFMDFNDLLKLFRDNEFDFEDMLIDYMNKQVETLEANLSIDEDNQETRIVESHVIAYIDRHELELGLENATGEFKCLEKAPPNQFLNTMAQEVVKACGHHQFLLVTLDRSVFKFVVNEEDKVFFKLYKV